MPTTTWLVLAQYLPQKWPVSVSVCDCSRERNIMVAVASYQKRLKRTIWALPSTSTSSSVDVLVEPRRGISFNASSWVARTGLVGTVDWEDKHNHHSTERAENKRCVERKTRQTRREMEMWTTTFRRLRVARFNVYSFSDFNQHYAEFLNPNRKVIHVSLCFSKLSYGLLA